MLPIEVVHDYKPSPSQVPVYFLIIGYMNDSSPSPSPSKPFRMQATPYPMRRKKGDSYLKRRYFWNIGVKSVLHDNDLKLIEQTHQSELVIFLSATGMESG